MANKELLLKIGGDASGALRAMDQVSSKTQRVGKKMQSAGRSMTTKVTAPIAAGFGFALKKTMDFEEGMNKVSAISGATGSDLTALEDKARELGSSTAFSATEAADGMAFLAQAGFETNEILSSSQDLLNLASASGLDLASTMDIASNVMQPFQIGAEESGRVADTLAEAASSANVDVAMLGESFKDAAPVASSLGFTFEETTAALGLLGNAGIQGSKAGTTLKNVMTSVANPVGKAGKVIEKLGLDVRKSDGSLKSLNDIVQELEDSGASAEQVMTIFGKRAGPGMLALLKSGEGAIGDFAGELESAQGRAAEMAETQMQGLPGVMKKFRSAVEAASISIGKSGLGEFLQRIIEGATNLFLKIEELNPTVLKVATVFAGLVAVLGPLLWIAGSMVTAISALGPIFAGITMAVAGPIVAVAALVAALVIAYNKSAAFRDIVHRAFAAVQQIIGKVIPVVREIIETFIAWAIRWWEKWGGDIIAFLETTWKQVSSILTSAFEVIRGIFRAAVTVLTEFWERFGKHIVDFGKRFLGRIADFFEKTWTNVKRIFSGVLDVIRGIFDTFIGVFTGDWDRAWEGVKAIFSGVWRVITGLFSQVLAGITAIFAAAWDTIKTVLGAGVAFLTQVWSGAWAKVKEIFVAAWEAQERAIQAGIDWLRDTFSALPGKILGWLGDLGSLLLNAGKSVVDGFIRGITSGFRKVRDKLSELTSMLPDWKGPAKRDATILKGAGHLVMQGFEDGLVGGMDSVKSTLGGLTSSLSPVAVGGYVAHGGGGYGAPAPTSSVTVERGAVQLTVGSDADGDDVREVVDEAFTRLLDEIGTQ